jgi:hypothetical protein
MKYMINFLHIFFHQWKYQWYRNGGMGFYTRKCKTCGQQEIKHIGGLGDKKWHNVEETWKEPRELERWREAKEWDGESL